MRGSGQSAQQRKVRYALGKAGSSLQSRRSARVNIMCPVKVSGKLANNLSFEETANVVTISKFGAKLKTDVPLIVGMQIKLAPQRGRNSGVFKVVWVGRDGTPRAGEAGVEYPHETTDILGVSFPD